MSSGLNSFEAMSCKSAKQHKPCEAISLETGRRRYLKFESEVGQGQSSSLSFSCDKDWKNLTVDDTSFSDMLTPAAQSSGRLVLCLGVQTRTRGIAVGVYVGLCLGIECALGVGRLEYLDKGGDGGLMQLARSRSWLMMPERYAGCLCMCVLAHLRSWLAARSKFVVVKCAPLACSPGHPNNHHHLPSSRLHCYPHSILHQ
jgi:hypothetical protein